MASEIVPFDDRRLLHELRDLISGARERVAVSVNRELVLLYWDLGQRIRVEVLGEERAAYGEQILPTLSAKLQSEFGKMFEGKMQPLTAQLREQFAQSNLLEAEVKRNLEGLGI